MVELHEFVAAFKDERDNMLDSYVGPDPQTLVGRLLVEAELNDEQKRKVFAALDTALTDAFYSILLFLDGAAGFGFLMQQSYVISDGDGHIVSEGRGELEALAYEMLHAQSEKQ